MLAINSLVSIAKPIVDRFPLVANMYRSVRDQLDFLKQPIATPWGFNLSGDAAMAEGYFETEETELIRNLLKDVDVMINIGANVGYYCCHALSLGKKVIAFEPIPRNLRYLYQNVKVNGWSCEIDPIALSNRVNIIEMYGGDTGSSLIKGWAGTSASYVSLVPCSTMDLVLGNRLVGQQVLVLVDVEGAEKWVLEGAKKMLANVPKPIWLIEISVNEHQPQGVDVNPNLTDTFRCMFDAGYQAFTVGKNTHLVTMADVEAAQMGDMSVFETHNFLFHEI